MVTPLAPVVARGRALVQDLRLLGAGAPVRAGLELSKRVGGHAAVFGRLARQGADPTARHELAWTHPLPVVSADDLGALDPGVRARTIAEADAIVRGTIELFGQQLDLGPDPDWHAAIDDPGRWPLAPWWEIDIRSAARLGDVKWVWELGRHRHLVILARAVALEPGNARWLDALNHQVDSWLTANPPEIGIHWYSNLEVALRAIAWCEILGLAGDALHPGTRTEMVASLHHSGRHLLADLPYTVSTMRNNHLLGDALGLLVLGEAFVDDARAKRWRSVGDRLFEQQLQRQVHPDGAQIEDAVSYHRFVLEMLLTRLRLGASGPDVRRATRTTAELLVRLGVFEGAVPRYGDGDEGRVLVSTGSFDDLIGSTVAGLLASGGDDPGGPAHLPVEQFDEVAWYPLAARRGAPRATGTLSARPTGPTGPTPPVVAPAAVAAAPPAPGGLLVGGGIARAWAGPWSVWLKAGGDTSHGHADLCSTVIAWRAPGEMPAGAPPARVEDDLATPHLVAADPGAGDAWLVGDPGTGAYNGPAAERDYFRSTVAHSALRLADEDQLVPYRAFRWRYQPVGGVAAPLVVDGTVVLWGWHGAYRRLDPPRRVVRVVVLEPGPARSAPAGEREATSGGSGRVSVIDWVEGPGGLAHALSLPLAPATTYEGGMLAPDPRRDERFRLVLPSEPTAHRGREHPFDGWWSASYGARVPATRLEVRGTVQGPVLWFIDAPGGAGTADPVVDGATVRLSSGRDVLVTFADDHAQLAVGATRATLATP
jgi:hypothetical protein